MVVTGQILGCAEGAAFGAGDGFWQEIICYINLASLWLCRWLSVGFSSPTPRAGRRASSWAVFDGCETLAAIVTIAVFQALLLSHSKLSCLERGCVCVLDMCAWAHVGSDSPWAPRLVTSMLALLKLVTYNRHAAV
jgi:hypothetical protein